MNNIKAKADGNMKNNKLEKSGKIKSGNNKTRNNKTGKNKKKKTGISGGFAKGLVTIAVFALLVLGLTLLCIRGYRFGRAVFLEEGGEESPGRDVTLVVEAGDSVKDVAAKLKELNVIKDETVFVVQVKLYEGDFIPGTYELNTSSSAEDVIETLSEEPATEE